MTVPSSLVVMVPSPSEKGETEGQHGPLAKASLRNPWQGRWWRRKVGVWGEDRTTAVTGQAWEG